MVVVGCSTSIFTKIMHSQCKKAVLIQWNKHLCGWGSHPPEVLYFIFEVKTHEMHHVPDPLLSSSTKNN